MRHPLTGGGMTVALSDTRLLCEMLQPLPNFDDAIATARSTAEFYTKRKPVSATINTLANALYKVCACARGKGGGSGTPQHRAPLRHSWGSSTQQHVTMPTHLLRD